MNLRGRLDNLRRRLEHWFRWPVTWLWHYYGHILPEGHQICKHCGQADGWDFHVSDEAWAQIAGPYVNRVVCLGCFWRRAEAKGIDPRQHIQTITFRYGLEFRDTGGPAKSTGAGGDRPVSDQLTPLERAMAIMQLAKLPPGYEPAIVPSGFIEALKALMKVAGDRPMEQGDGEGGWSPKSVEHYTAYTHANRLMTHYDLLRCLAPSEWARAKSRLVLLQDVIAGREGDSGGQS